MKVEDKSIISGGSALSLLPQPPDGTPHSHSASSAVKLTNAATCKLPGHPKK